MITSTRICAMGATLACIAVLTHSAPVHAGPRCQAINPTVNRQLVVNYQRVPSASLISDSSNPLSSFSAPQAPCAPFSAMSWLAGFAVDYPALTRPSASTSANPTFYNYGTGQQQLEMWSSRTVRGGIPNQGWGWLLFDALGDTAVPVVRGAPPGQPQPPAPVIKTPNYQAVAWSVQAFADLMGTPNGGDGTLPNGMYFGDRAIFTNSFDSYGAFATSMSQDGNDISIGAVLPFTSGGVGGATTSFDTLAEPICDAYLRNQAYTGWGMEYDYAKAQAHILYGSWTFKQRTVLGIPVWVSASRHGGHYVTVRGASTGPNAVNGTGVWSAIDPNDPTSPFGTPVGSISVSYGSVDLFDHASTITNTITLHDPARYQVVEAYNILRLEHGGDCGPVHLVMSGPNRGMCEGDSNLALGRPAYQSSTTWDGDASRAVDGNTDGNYWNGSVTHTGVSPNEYWYVDLGAVKQIRHVNVFNRTDYGSELLSHFNVYAWDPNVGWQLIADRSGSDTRGQSMIPIAVSTSTQYVMIQKTDSAPLHMAEVQIIGQ